MWSTLFEPKTFDEACVIGSGFSSKKSTTSLHDWFSAQHERLNELKSFYDLMKKYQTQQLAKCDKDFFDKKAELLLFYTKQIKRLGQKSHKKKPLLIVTGPCGVGKTMFVKLLANHFSFEKLEYDALSYTGEFAESVVLSSTTSKFADPTTGSAALKQNSLEKFLGSGQVGMQDPSFKKQIIVIDDIYGEFSFNQNSTLYKLNCLENQYTGPSYLMKPIIIIANQLNHPIFKKLTCLAEVVYFNSLTSQDVATALEVVWKKSREAKTTKSMTSPTSIPTVSQKDINNWFQQLANSSGGDVRSAINQLQMFETCPNSQVSLAKTDQIRSQSIFDLMRTFWLIPPQDDHSNIIRHFGTFSTHEIAKLLFFNYPRVLTRFHKLQNYYDLGQGQARSQNKAFLVFNDSLLECFEDYSLNIYKNSSSTGGASEGFSAESFSKESETTNNNERLEILMQHMVCLKREMLIILGDVVYAKFKEFCASGQYESLEKRTKEAADICLPHVKIPIVKQIGSSFASFAFFGNAGVSAMDALNKKMY